MAKYRVCEKCGAALDHGEICDCDHQGATSPILKRANQDAFQEAIHAEAEIHLIKNKGSDHFQSQINASSASVALNGLAVLIQNYANIVGVSPLEVLALLASAMERPVPGQGD